MGEEEEESCGGEGRNGDGETGIGRRFDIGVLWIGVSGSDEFLGALPGVLQLQKRVSFFRGEWFLAVQAVECGGQSKAEEVFAFFRGLGKSNVCGY